MEARERGHSEAGSARDSQASASTDVQRWADPAMFKAEPVEEATPRVYLLSATQDPLGAIAAACMMYEGKVCRNIDRDVTDGMRRHYWEQVQKTHLKAPLEFVDLHFMIEGVTRSFTHQMVRQRTAVYAQESMRFAVKENLAAEAALPPSLMTTAPRAERDPSLFTDEIDAARDTWDDTLEVIQNAYNTLVNMGVPAEDARGLLPHATTTRLNYKTNLRSLLDHAGNRLCTQAQFEWRFVFNEIIAEIRDYGNGDDDYTENWQWNHIADSNVFKPICYTLGHCPFTASFDRGCTIRERVQRGEFDKIDPREWMMDHTAARRGG